MDTLTRTHSHGHTWFKVNRNLFAFSFVPPLIPLSFHPPPLLIPLSIHFLLSCTPLSSDTKTHTNTHTHTHSTKDHPLSQKRTDHTELQHHIPLQCFPSKAHNTLSHTVASSCIHTICLRARDSCRRTVPRLLLSPGRRDSTEGTEFGTHPNEPTTRCDRGRPHPQTLMFVGGMGGVRED